VCLLGMLINSQHTWRATVAHLSWNIAWFLVSLGILRYPALSLGILGLRVGSSPAIKNSGHVHVNSIKQHITYKPDYNHHHQQQPSRVDLNRVGVRAVNLFSTYSQVPAAHVK